eukprot:SAG31_NODE_8387_length_1461_cov_1.298091_1_plen_52_part_10
MSSSFVVIIIYTFVIIIIMYTNLVHAKFSTRQAGIAIGPRGCARAPAVHADK